MENTAARAIAIVGVGAVLPDAPNVAAFWENIKKGRYSISEVQSERWDPARYFDPDPKAPDKTYSKIGGWVRESTWDPVRWRLPIPPRVADAMDGSQKWAIACTREALEDYGYPKRPLDPDRTAVILGNAMGGERHYFTVMRVYFPEYEQELRDSSSFAALPQDVRTRIIQELHDRMGKHLPEITEDSMPGELANCIAGRIANIFNFHGPNYVCDAACASAMAAISSAAEGLIQHHYDSVITGGIDRNMGASTYVKFCKIGALSATGTRPYAEGADGFVMGEGAAFFLLKRLADAERDNDKVYAVLRGMGASSDGKGKGITAPNPAGQKFAIERAWHNAGLSPETVTYIEGHGTSTRVGDVVEVQSMADVLSQFHLPAHSVALGSVKSNLGHLKGAAGAAGLLKVILALHDKVLPPSVHCEHPNPDIDFAHSPLYVNTSLQPWSVSKEGARQAGLSAFGFGGTNFHAVVEEYIPHRLNGNGKRTVTVSEGSAAATETPMFTTNTSADKAAESSCKAPLRGALVIGAPTVAELVTRLRTIETDAKEGRVPILRAPLVADLRAPERLAIDYADAKELASKNASALKALSANQPAVWKALRAQGIYRGQGPAPKVAFLYPGQGSQYVNMLEPLRAMEPIVAKTFEEADRIMTPLLGRPLSAFVFADRMNADALAKAEEDLRQTAITQPAVLTVDLALTRLLAAYGIEPDFTMGHSLGEYGALIAAGGLPFADALEAVSARGREMTRFSPDDKGRMAAVFAPLEEIERILKTINGYVVIANINSEHQSVIGGASDAVEHAMDALINAGYEVAALPVSHAFHTSIVAPASGPLRSVLERLHLQSPRLPIVANTNGEFYPTDSNVVPKMLDILAEQVAAPVQFIKGLRTLYDAGARMFVEVGPKKALQGFAEDVLGAKGDVVSIFTNHPKTGDIPALNQALCCLWAAGLGRGIEAVKPVEVPTAATLPVNQQAASAAEATPTPMPISFGPSTNGDRYSKLGQFFAGVLEQAWKICDNNNQPTTWSPVTITGAALGLPGTDHIFDDTNVARILRGDQFITPIPMQFRQAMLDKHITRLVKSDNGGPTFETINDVADVVKLAGRGGAFDLEKEFGVSADRVAALDRITQLAMAAGLDALRDAGIPLVLRYKTTTKGTSLPDRWALPDELRDDTGVIFASAFPGLDSLADEMARYYADHSRREQISALETLRAKLKGNGPAPLGLEIDGLIANIRAKLEREPYVFERRFLLRTLSMGHSQFAEFVGARGPNTQINSACASTTQAVALAEDWIRAGRCSRVVIISADDVTSDHLLDWMGAGFLASGAAATDEAIADAAIPFDRRRHGLVIGMGAAAMVVESAEAARERGIRPICEVLSTVTNNSAFHGTRLDVQHIGQVMENLISGAESSTGISRKQIAAHTVFVSHETYTPARGGSASAEIHALRRVFGDVANQIVIANTKGLTGHAMGTGIEDVVAVKALETGLVPPVANFKEVDPELGQLNLSKGGAYDVDYAIHLGAGFGSQISMILLRWTRSNDGTRNNPDALGYQSRIADGTVWQEWLNKVARRPVAELEVLRRTLRIPEPSVAVQSERIEVQGVITPAVETAKPIQKSTPLPSEAEPVSTLHATTGVITQDASTTAVKECVLALAAEKTGYPVDMLDLDLDLEADLGIDTVKQAEVFATIRETYNIPRDENRKLRDYPTLAHVIRFVYEKRPDLAATTPAPQRTATVPVAAQQPLPMEQRASLKVEPAAAAIAVAETPNVQPVADVRERVLNLVVEKTGYPKDMLDLELDLEADLGVDTVKQAEMFAAIREIYNIPRDENRKLRDYPTLAHVIRFVYDKRPDLAPIAPSTSVQAPAGTTTLSAHHPPSAPVEAATPAISAAKTTNTPPADEVQQRVLDLVVQKTGYPKDMLDLDLDLEADLGVDTVKQAEMFAAIREIYNIPRDENRKLRDYPTLAHVIRFVYEKRPDLVPGALSAPATPASEPTLAPAVPVQTIPNESIQDRVLEIVADKTGYPKEMLDLDLDLEADLGIDTVKQAEMFAAIRATYKIPRDENLKLRDFPTLAHVIKFAQDRAGLPTATPQEKLVPTAVPLSAKQKRPRSPLATFDATNRIPRRVPTPVLRPPTDLCKTTGVTLSGARILVVSDQGGVADSLTARLQALQANVLQISAGQDEEHLTSTLKNWISAGPISGIYWLPALDDEGSLREMDALAWRRAVELRVKSFYATMRTLYDLIAKPGTFLISATRLGGQHGYDEAGASAPLGGAVSGFTKTYKRERMDALVKVVDFEKGLSAQEVANSLVQETLQDPGAVEIGYKQGLRWTMGLTERPADDGQPGLILDEKTVFVVTGAAGSIVSAITADLAAASAGTFYLLDLIPEPDPANVDLKRFHTDKEGLKRDLFTRIQARGERATPALVEKELASLERAQAALAAMDAVRTAGGTAHYFCINLTDADAVAKVVDRVRATSGRIDVLLHAAGIERSRALGEKERRDFDLVFDVKSDGLFHLLHAIGDMPLGTVVAFSSIAGRFGNPGQTDYSSANDLLCKVVSSFRTTRPQTRGIAIDWTAWGGIGMATRGSIPKVMEAAGIDMLPPEAGVPLIRRELTAGNTRGEIVIGERLGVLLNEWDETSGVDPSSHVLGGAKLTNGPMLGKILSMGIFSPLTIELPLDPKVQPFLYDHQIDGTPVLPGVMGIEAFAEAALSVLPGWNIASIEDVDFLAPFKFYRNEPRTLTVEVSFRAHGNEVIADCRLIGRRLLPNQPAPQSTLHFLGRVVLSRTRERTFTPSSPRMSGNLQLKPQDIYRIYFHGPAYQVLEKAGWDDHRMIGKLTANLPLNHVPPDAPTLMSPRWIELCFQTAGLWEIGTQNRMGLPHHVDRISLSHRIPDERELFATVTPDPMHGSFDAEIVDKQGNSYLQLSGYRTVAMPTSLSPEITRELRAILVPSPVAA